MADNNKVVVLVFSISQEKSHNSKVIKKIKANFYRIQRHDSNIWVYYSIGLIDFMLNNKSLTDFTSQFLRYNLNIFYLHDTV